MLTASQCRTVAYLTDGGLICPACALKRTNEVQLARIDEGLDDTLRPVSAYELGEHEGESAWQFADQEGLEGAEAEAFMENYHEPCDDCFEPLDSSADSSWV